MADKVQPTAPEAEKLTPEELEQVEGSGGANFVFADGSVRFADGSVRPMTAAELATWQANYGRTT